MEHTKAYRKERAAEVADWRRRMKAAGLCNRCGQRPPRRDGPSCQSCYQKQHVAYLASKNSGTHLTLTRRSAGLCTGCGGEPEAGGATCLLCRARRRALSFSRRIQGIRYKAMERDAFRCRLCGSTRSLVIHHRNGKGDGCGEPDDRLSNLITLCARCHSPLTYLRRFEVNRQLAAKLLLAS